MRRRFNDLQDVEVPLLSAGSSQTRIRFTASAGPFLRRRIRNWKAETPQVYQELSFQIQEDKGFFFSKFDIVITGPAHKVLSCLKTLPNLE